MACSPGSKVVDDPAGLGYPAGMNKPPSFSPSRLLGLGCGAAVMAMVLVLAGCSGISSGISIGIGLPIGGLGGVGVSVGSDGRVSGNVGVGTGHGSVRVGGSAQLPRTSEQAASAPSP